MDELRFEVAVNTNSVTIMENKIYEFLKQNILTCCGGCGCCCCFWGGANGAGHYAVCPANHTTVLLVAGPQGKLRV